MKTVLFTAQWSVGRKSIPFYWPKTTRLL